MYGSLRIVIRTMNGCRMSSNNDIHRKGKGRAIVAKRYAPKNVNDRQHHPNANMPTSTKINLSIALISITVHLSNTNIGQLLVKSP